MNTENYFFGRDVTYLPKRDIFLRPDNHVTLDKTLCTYIHDTFRYFEGVNYTPGPLFNQACVKVTAKSCMI